MPWQVGIDEAGYGPNLGPFVVAAVAHRVDSAGGDGWRLLAPNVGRVGSSARVIVDDSKAVYAPKKDLARLEVVALALARAPATVGRLLAALGTDADDFGFDADEALPPPPDDAVLSLAAVGPAFARVVPAAVFNARLDHLGKKSEVAAEVVADLIRAVLAELPAGEPLEMFLDRQGGRTKYAEFFQRSCGSWVWTDAESPDLGRYRAEVAGRPVTFTVVPKADARYFPVAAASMTAKYVRELLMRQWNRFWTGRVPGLAPTAGYPVDARRFFAAIRTILGQLNVAESAVWRRK